MKTLEETAMQGTDRRRTPAISPGVWSTDDYIRRWAQSLGMTGECVVPLQSLQNEWKAKINFDVEGQPVERTATALDSPLLLRA
ncbi:hypothetical protein [Noviherbaspirillum denitrificans]|uniref:hypothetical protein n=1 Tax=Noviherbaspirillum denitrificans TaxID=1968433 RepID=UPI0011305A13|nr:hypothetical protein [Noviherbaspirillum denitrificans]